MGKERVRCFVPEGSQKRKATRVRSLRQRWIVNSVVPIFVLLALIVGGVSLGISNYYYKGMLDGLERQARAQSGAFVDYFMDQGFCVLTRPMGGVGWTEVLLIGETLGY